MEESENRSIVVSKPFGLFNIELTNKCPMRCVMCPRTNNMTRDEGIIDYELFKRIIDELVAENRDYINHQPVWLHHFGESLQHPKFAECIQYAVRQKIITCLSVNPLMLSEKTSTKLIEANPDILYISLDGHDDQSFEKIRGVKNAYHRSISNLHAFLEKKEEMKGSSQIILSMIDFDLNRSSIERTKSFWEAQAGVDQFLMKSFSTWDGSANDINTLSAESSPLKHQNLNRVECNFPWERMTVLWDGEVVPCCNDYNKKLSLGNLNDQTLSDIWNGSRMRQLREEFISNDVTNPLCHHCEKLRLPREYWDW